jgi:hypothetical protein
VYYEKRNIKHFKKNRIIVFCKAASLQKTSVKEFTKNNLEKQKYFDSLQNKENDIIK